MATQKTTGCEWKSGSRTLNLTEDVNLTKLKDMSFHIHKDFLMGNQCKLGWVVAHACHRLRRW